MLLGKLLVKGSESENIRVSSFFGKLRMKTVPSLRRVTAVAKQFAEIDSVGNFAEFEKAISPLVHTKQSIQAAYYGSESYKYGYYNELLKYSHTDFTSFSLLPGMEHGVRFSSVPVRYNSANVAYACHSDNRICEIHDKNKYMPVFVIGPYVNYAEPYYSEEKTAELKKKLGKTLLVVLSHSYEGDASRNAAENLVETVYERYGSDFDTVMVCVYWNDVKEPEVEGFRQRGAFLVSAGFREDPNFVRRLRTVISLADYVVGNDIGTNMGYCMALGKQYALICSGNREPDDQYYTKAYNDFDTAFTPADGKYEFTADQKRAQKELCRRWWGIGEFERTPEEMGAILSLVHKLCKLSGYSMEKRDDTVKRLLSGEDGKLTEQELRLLRQAVGK